MVLVSPVSSLCIHRNQIFVRHSYLRRQPTIKAELRCSERKTEDLPEISIYLYCTISSVRNTPNVSKSPKFFYR